MDNKPNENNDKTNFPEESIQLVEVKKLNPNDPKDQEEVKENYEVPNEEVKENKEVPKEEVKENKEAPKEDVKENKEAPKEEVKENKEAPKEDVKENKEAPKEDVKENKEGVLSNKKFENDPANPLLVNHFKTDLELQNDIADQRFKEDIESLHPRKVNENGELEKFPCCSTSTGWFTCSDEGLKCDLDNFGVGIVVYFKILKCLLICFFLICVFNIPLYIIYVGSSSKQITNYKDALFLTSIGNIGSSILLLKKPFKTVTFSLFKMLLIMTTITWY